MSAMRPMLDAWYQDEASGRQFQVVAIDDDTDSISVQFLNGDIGDYDSASWDESPISAIEAPEDWTAPFDDVELDDRGYSDPDFHSRDIQDLTIDDLLDSND